MFIYFIYITKKVFVRKKKIKIVLDTSDVHFTNKAFIRVIVDFVGFSLILYLLPFGR